MSLIKFWLRNLASRTSQKAAQRPRKLFPTIVNYRIPRVEELEDRTLPSATISSGPPPRSQ